MKKTNGSKQQKLAVIAAIVAVAITSLVIISQSNVVIANPEGPPDTLKVVDMTIEIDKSVFTPSEFPVPLLKANKGQTIPIPMILKSETDRVLHSSFKVTFGALNTAPILPPGVHALFTPVAVDLPARGMAPTNLVLQIDNDAPDGKYDISIMADSKDTSYATGFTLIVGKRFRILHWPRRTNNTTTGEGTMKQQAIAVFSIAIVLMTVLGYPVQPILGDGTPTAYLVGAQGGAASQSTSKGIGSWIKVVVPQTIVTSSTTHYFWSGQYLTTNDFVHAGYSVDLLRN